MLASPNTPPIKAAPLAVRTLILKDSVEGDDDNFPACEFAIPVLIHLFEESFLIGLDFLRSGFRFDQDERCRQ